MTGKLIVARDLLLAMGWLSLMPGIVVLVFVCGLTARGREFLAAVLRKLGVRIGTK